MDRLPGYDNWKLASSPVGEDIKPPQLDTVCMKCGQYLLNMDGTPTDTWDCTVEYDYEWNDTTWTYWHDHCHEKGVA